MQVPNDTRFYIPWTQEEYALQWALWGECFMRYHEGKLFLLNVPIYRFAKEHGIPVEPPELQVPVPFDTHGVESAGRAASRKVRS